MLVKEWARLEGLHPQTVWKWCRQGTMPVPVEQTPTGMWLIHDPKYETMPQSKSMEPRTVCYARVSMCFVKFLWAVSAFLLVRLSGCF